MNIRVDLILEKEQRSGSIINFKSIMRIASLVVPISLLIFGTIVTLNCMRLKNECNMFGQQKEAVISKAEKAKSLKESIIKNARILKELEGWEKSRIIWYKQLTDLQKHVSPSIQFKVLNVNYDVKLTGKAPARFFTLSVDGKAIGHNAADDVQQLRHGIANTSQDEKLIESVRVTKFGASTEKNAKKDDRVFQIVVTYQPRNL